MPHELTWTAILRSSMQAAGKEQEFQDLLSQTESAKLEGGALDTACTALQELVSSVALKDKVLEQACKLAPLVAHKFQCAI